MGHILVAAISYDAHRGGGGVRLAYDLVQGLVREGHRVTVICEDLHGAGAGMREENGVNVLRYRLPPARGIGSRRHLEHIQAATVMLQEELDAPPDTVHGHSLFQYVAALRLYGSRAHCCYSIHSPFVEELRIAWRAQGLRGRIKELLGLRIVRRLERECLLESAALTAESEFTRRLMAREHGTEVAARIEVIPGWVDCDRFRPISPDRVAAVRRQLGWPERETVLFVVRRLEARMGLDNLLRALDRVRNQGYSLRTFIGGEGSQRAQLEALMRRLGLEREVTFMGFVSGADLPLAYGACDASLVPTQELECFGIIALESLACGRPTFVTPVGALPEVVSGFEPRWIASARTPEQIADLLCAYLSGRIPIRSAEELRAQLVDRYGFSGALRAYRRILGLAQTVGQEA